MLLNLRDFLAAWQGSQGLGGQERLLTLVEHLATRSPSERIHALIFEDSGGEAFPWDFSHPIAVVRRVMDAHGWTDGHWLAHLHKKVRGRSCCCCCCCCCCC